MTPNIVSAPTGVLNEYDEEVEAKIIPQESRKPKPRPLQLVWRNIIIFGILHVFAVYGCYLMFTSAKLLTTLFSVSTLTINFRPFHFSAISMWLTCGIGITVGAHRLWSHRAYKAAWQLRLFLTICNTMAFQNSIIEWSRDHRVHHKYSETDADPHNAKRGFFFAHMGWLLCKKHPDVKNLGKKIDMSDLYADPILRFQHKYYEILLLLACFVIPVLVPMYCWNELFVTAFCTNISRLMWALHATWFVNSAAHMWGFKPYDKFINPSENLFVVTVTLGEGYHNYHHIFPWDYKTSELKYSLNLSTAIIDFFATIGWAYDLKTVSEDMIRKRVARTGDGTHEIWGWGDKDQPKDDYVDATVLNRKS